MQEKDKSVEFPEEVKKELAYLSTQLQLGQPLHQMVEKSLKRLEEYGYPSEKVKAIRTQFEKPAEERQKDLERCKTETGWRILECLISSGKRGF